ncbi:MAG: hypothetical protein IJ011_05710 [Clostridia bacterium]|nr:hypothetical protein [Clostridia bacterium]
MKDLKINVVEAESALTEKPMLATASERFLILNEIKSEYKDLPHPLRFSRYLSILLSRVSTPVEKYDLIAGRYVDRVLTEDEERAFAEYIKHPDYPGKEVILSSGHCSYSWETLVNEGLCGLRKRAEKTLAAAESEDKKIFLRAMLEVHRAIADYMLRYADAAEQKGLVAVANDLRKTASERPETFREALQLLWIVTLINCAYVTENPTLTVGRLDKILYPLYRADVEGGRLTREEAKALITDYYCKHNLIMGRGEHQVGDDQNSTTFKRILNFDAPQYLLLAGTDENGESAVSELTELFAECIVPSFKNPVVVVRYFEGMDKAHPRLWRTLTDKALKSSSLMFYNDNSMLKTYARIGIPEADSRKYEHFGCNWPSLGPDSVWIQGGPKAYKYEVLSEDEKKELVPFMRMNTEHGWPEDLIIVLRELAEITDREISIEDVYNGFFERMSDFIDRKLSQISRELRARQRKPSALLTFRDCFAECATDSGECISANAKYYYELQSFQMFATVADSFTVVDKLVFTDKRLTLSELLEAVECDFVGYENILALCRSVEKYGSDSALSNYHSKRLSERACELTIEKSRPYLEREHLFLVPCMQSDTWHLKNGETFGATPDGRRAHTPFSQNTRPSNGSCINGITGLFNSMLSLPADGLLSGALNLDINPADYKGEDGHALFSLLLGNYFDRGGLHAQVTAVGADTLIEAQRDPDAHRDIRVRVTGYSGVFVDICERLQNDIIERLK